jgi:hypothetical protein
MGIKIDERQSQFMKAPSPMLITEFGIIIEVSALQHPKASFPILVTELGIMIDVRPKQPWKAYAPMLVTELGIIIEVRSQFWKASFPILVTEKVSPLYSTAEGIETDVFFSALISCRLLEVTRASLVSVSKL